MNHQLARYIIQVVLQRPAAATNEVASNSREHHGDFPSRTGKQDCAHTHTHGIPAATKQEKRNTPHRSEQFFLRTGHEQFFRIIEVPY
jgi:uncharacterized Zn-binding protein involved in type VI secretion